MNEKHSILSPFDITSKLLGPYVFSATGRETLGEKMEYYFQDHSFMPLFIQVRFPPLATYFNSEIPSFIIFTGKLPQDATCSIKKLRWTGEDIERTPAYGSCGRIYF